MRASRGWGSPGRWAAGRSRRSPVRSGRSPRDGWQVRGLYAGTSAVPDALAPSGASRSSGRPAGGARRTRPAAHRRAAATPGATIGASASTTIANPSTGPPGTRRRRPGRARRRAPRRSTSPATAGARPRARGPSGVRDQIADPAHRPTSRPVIGRAGLADRRAGPPPPQPRALGLGPDLPGRGDGDERRIEVVERRRRDERLRQLCDPPDEVGAPLRIELAEDVVEQEQGRPAVERGQEVQLGELEGEDGRPLLAARGEPGQVAPVELEGEVVAVRADERGAVPDLLLGRLASRRASASRGDSPGSAGAFVT